MAEQAWTGLAEAISAIRAELTAAIEPDAGLRFRAGTVELELSVDVRTEADGKVKVRVFPGLGADGGVTQSAGTTQRLKLVLQPVEADGTDQLIGASASSRPL
ncbi:hypothetical protein P3T36_000986 [Kitasatospora sp. MAP12-15]|uniref:trypco2 family protein n=1 Tax=unclassified Kitasatospora TaxID=2633591 RepID=UPI0024772727|nr:trypco2 family protein [Kitasatospora sp. MAP12-44]MDH6114587.1 hypothetical protein [Kitasatospora sp. MAP12-44]